MNEKNEHPVSNASDYVFEENDEYIGNSDPSEDESSESDEEIDKGNIENFSWKIDKKNQIQEFKELKEKAKKLEYLQIRYKTYFTAAIILGGFVTVVLLSASIFLSAFLCQDWWQHLLVWTPPIAVFILSLITCLYLYNLKNNEFKKERDDRLPENTKKEEKKDKNLSRKGLLSRKASSIQEFLKKVTTKEQEQSKNEQNKDFGLVMDEFDFEKIPKKKKKKKEKKQVHTKPSSPTTNQFNYPPAQPKKFKKEFLMLESGEEDGTDLDILPEYSDHFSNSTDGGY